MLKTRPRRIIALIVVAFILYAIYTAPTRSADATHGILNVIENAVTAVFRFFDALLRR